MKKPASLAVLLSVFAVLSFVACGSKGETGAPGEKGQQGAKGDPGARGDAGPPGTANVTYSSWFAPAAYTKTTVFGTVTFSYTLPVPELTQDVLDRGSVQVFGKLNGYNTVIWPTDQVSELPVVIQYMSGSTPTDDVWSANYALGSMEITLTSSTNAYTSISNAHQFRYVIIPGAVGVDAGT